MQNKDEIQLINDSFIMSPKVDFAFKMLFGDEKNKDLLIALLSSILKLSKEEFEGVELLNTELLREFKEDKKGILDIRAGLKNGEQIDVEIQILPTQFMPQRTLFYWAKMYLSQIHSGDTYQKLKKCITINIVDFECTKGNKIHTQYHLTEDEVGDRLTEVLEIHFLEIPKLNKLENLTDKNDPIIEWLEFLNANSREVMEMLAQKNEEIAKAYDLLEKMSQNKVARMAYEAREAELKDRLTFEREAIERGIEEGKEIGEEIGREEGLEEGREIGREEVLRNAIIVLLEMLDDEDIASKMGVPIEKVKEVRASRK